NVYLPDDLADAVRQANVPVSAVCQQALEEAVRRVTAVTEATSGKASAAFAGRGPFTGRLRRALTLARDAAIERGHGWVGCEHLLLGLVEEPEGIAGRALRVSGAEATAVRNEVLRQLASSALGHRVRLPRRVARHWAELDPVERARIVETMQPIGRGGAHQGEGEASSDVGAKLDEVLRRLEAMETRLGPGA